MTFFVIIYFDRIYLVFSFIQKGPFKIFRYPKGGPGPPRASPLDRPLLISHGHHGTCANSHVSAACCKLVPLGRATFWKLKPGNFHHCPWFPWDIYARFFSKQSLDTFLCGVYVFIVSSDLSFGQGSQKLYNWPTILSPPHYRNGVHHTVEMICLYSGELRDVSENIKFYAV